jgi:hypothetical protein
MAPAARVWSRNAVIWTTLITALAVPATARAQNGRDDLLNCYYNARTSDPAKARACLQSAVDKYPTDPIASLELAYLLDGEGHKRDAFKIFDRVAHHGDDRARRKQACAAAEVLAPLARKQLSTPAFAEVYAAPDYYSNIRTGTLPFEVRAGIEPAARSEIYGQLRLLADSNSGRNSAGESPIYFDNVLTFAGGARAQPFAKVGLVFLVETGRAYDLIDRNRPRWRFDERAGAIYYGEWSMASACPQHVSMPFRPVLDAYGESLYFSRYDDNWISTLRIRPGLRAVETSTFSLDVHVHLFGMTDTNGVASNHFVEIGPAARLTPDRRRPGRLAWETVWRYFQDGRRDVVTRVRAEYGFRW